MKKIIALILAMCFTLTAYAGNIKVLLNDTELTFDQPPVIENGRTLVPMRAIFETIGAKVYWDGEKQTITALYGTKLVEMVIDSDTAYIDGTATKLDVPPKIISGRTLVPLRFVAEALNCSVEWEGNTQTVVISTLNNQASYEQELQQLNDDFSALEKEAQRIADETAKNVTASAAANNGGNIDSYAMARGAAARKAYLEKALPFLESEYQKELVALKIKYGIKE